MSLYGHTADIHEAITDKPGSFDRSVAAIKRMRALGLHVTLKSPLFQVNIDHIAELRDFARNLGCPILVNPKVSAKEDGTHSPLALRPTDAQLQRYYGRNHMVGFGHDLPMDASMFPDRPAETSKSCGVGSALMVNPKGEVFPCTSVPVAVGNVRTTKLKKIWEESQLLKRFQAITWSNLEPCKSCDVRRYCNRCHGEAMLEDGNLLGKSSEACRHAVFLRDSLRDKGMIGNDERGRPPPTDLARVNRFDLRSVYPAPSAGKRSSRLRIV